MDFRNIQSGILETAKRESKYRVINKVFEDKQRNKLNMRNVLNENETLNENVKYINNTELENKPNNDFILVFDFDQTITKKHTGGNPEVYVTQLQTQLPEYFVVLNDYFGKDGEGLKYLKYFLKEYSKNYNIYINSRGVSNQIVEY